MAFDWHKYITIDPAFTKEQRHIIELSLNQISHFQDGEGEELFIKAFERNNSQPVAIKLGPDNVEGALTFLAKEGKAFVYFDRSRLEEAIRSAEPGNANLDLTKTIGHEFYHVGDDLKDVAQQSKQVLLKLLHLSPDDPQAKALTSKLDDTFFQRFIDFAKPMAKDLPPEVLLRQKKEICDSKFYAMAIDVIKDPSELEKLGFVELAHKLQAIPKQERLKALMDSGVVSGIELDRRDPGRWLPRFEQDASSYIDAAMTKNFGPYAPQEGRYGADVGSKSAAQAAQEQGFAFYSPSSGQSKYPTPGFTAESYPASVSGNLPSPAHIKPVPAAPDAPKR